MESSVREKIEKRAYELFLARGGSDGYHMEDWVKAEKEISSKQKGNKKSEVTSTSAKRSVGSNTLVKPKQSKPATATIAKKKVAKKKLV